MKLLIKIITFLLPSIILLSLCCFVFAEENEPYDLFPLYGVTLGKTTTEELSKIGQKSEEYEKYTVNTHSFYFHQNIATSLILTRYETIPEKWEKLGLNWRLSFDESVNLLREMGYHIQVTKFPTIVIEGTDTSTYKPYLSFSANFTAYKKSLFPTILLFSFQLGHGTKKTDKNTLCSITALYKPNIIDLPD